VAEVNDPPVPGTDVATHLREALAALDEVKSLGVV
jgi:hypothetical protein